MRVPARSARMRPRRPRRSLGRSPRKLVRYEKPQTGEYIYVEFI